MKPTPPDDNLVEWEQPRFWLAWLEGLHFAAVTPALLFGVCLLLPAVAGIAERFRLVGVPSRPKVRAAWAILP
jgi:hypothetical protein